MYEILFQITRDTIRFSQRPELGERKIGRPVPGAIDPDVICIIQGLVWKTAPLGEIDKMGHDIDDPFPLLVDIEEPDGTGKDAAGDGFIPTVYAFSIEAGVFRRSFFQ